MGHAVGGVVSLQNRRAASNRGYLKERVQGSSTQGDERLGTK